MIGTYSFRVCTMAMIICMLLSGICIAEEKKAETKEKEKPSGLAGKLEESLQDVVREERIELFKEIDRERKETLKFITAERLAVMEELKQQLKNSTETLLSERKTTMVDLEKLIDHFFIRLLQFSGIAIFSIGLLAIFFYALIVRRNRKTSDHPERI